MTKTPITWIGLLKQKISLKGKGTSIGDVAPEAKKEWVQIKEGKHPKYTQGKMTKSKSSTKKKGKKSKDDSFWEEKAPAKEKKKKKAKKGKKK